MISPAAAVAGLGNARRRRVDTGPVSRHNSLGLILFDCRQASSRTAPGARGLRASRAFGREMRSLTMAPGVSGFGGAPLLLNAASFRRNWTRIRSQLRRTAAFACRNLDVLDGIPGGAGAPPARNYNDPPRKAIGARPTQFAQDDPVPRKRRTDP